MKKPREFGEAQWVYEIGHPVDTNFNPDSDLMAPSKQNPIFMRKDTDERFEWRIRNLPYPKEVYTVEVDHTKQDIVLKTSNKKYYKRIDIPDMKRLGLKMEESSVVWKYQNNTVIIGYDKPDKIKEEEKKKNEEIKSMGASNTSGTYAGGKAGGSGGIQSLLGGPQAPSGPPEG